MSRDQGIAGAATDLGEMLRAAVLASFEVHRCVDSPIERLLYVAFAEYCRIFITDHGLNEVYPKPYGEPVDFACIAVAKQVRVLDWPIDFVFSVGTASSGVSHLAVECDGHDFHERTKEQAARDRSRDRALQAAGFTVMRFTGSEIHRDAVKCVGEIVAWAVREVSVSLRAGR